MFAALVSFAKSPSEFGPSEAAVAPSPVSLAVTFGMLHPHGSPPWWASSVYLRQPQTTTNLCRSKLSPSEREPGASPTSPATVTSLSPSPLSITAAMFPSSPAPPRSPRGGTLRCFSHNPSISSPLPSSFLLLESLLSQRGFLPSQRPRRRCLLPHLRSLSPFFLSVFLFSPSLLIPRFSLLSLDFRNFASLSLMERR